MASVKICIKAERAFRSNMSFVISKDFDNGDSGIYEMDRTSIRLKEKSKSLPRNAVVAPIDGQDAKTHLDYVVPSTSKCTILTESSFPMSLHNLSRRQRYKELIGNKLSSISSSFLKVVIQMTSRAR